jgi:hypothetical protein
MRVFAALLISVVAACGADLPAAHESLDEAARAAGLRPWKISVAPLVASQALDAASSYGMRELNPLLASSNGGFEMKAAAIKLGVTGVLIGVEYLIVRTTGIVTTGFAVHNFAIR